LVVVDGRRGPEYDGTLERTPIFSADGNRVAYGAKKGNKWLVVVDGQPGPEYDGILVGTPIFSANGKRVAYAAKTGGKWVVVVDGKAGPEYGVLICGPVFRPDGEVEYLASNTEEGRQVLYRVNHSLP
jgi:hypothetical protein